MVLPMVMLCTLSCALLCTGAPAFAEPDPAEQAAPATGQPSQADLAQAKAHYLRGEKLFSLGHFADAMTAYEAAYELSALPELLFNIGQCHRNLGNYETAVFSFRQFLKYKPEAPNREAVRALIQELEEQIAASAAAPNPLGNPPDEPFDRRDGAPAHTRWWLWSGAAAVAVTATIAVVWLLGDDGIPESDLGNVDFEHDRKRISPHRNRGVFIGLGHELRW